MAVKTSLDDHRRNVLKELARRKLSYLCEYVGTGDGPWMHSPHLDLLCDKVEEAVQWVGENHTTRKLIMVNMPPRFGKSQVVTRCTPTYFLGKHPDKEMITTSHTATLAKSFSRDARDIFTQYGEDLFGIRLDKGSTSTTEWHIEGHSGKMQAGAMGSVIGQGASLIIVDDPIREMEDAESPVMQEKLLSRFKSSIWSRLAPGGAIIIVMSRWHTKDLIGQLLDEAKVSGVEWEVINFPVTAVEDDILGRTVGDTLWPDRYSAEEIAQIRAVIANERIWQACWMQDPRTDKSGALWKIGLIESLRVHFNPIPYRTVVTWDPATTSNKKSDAHGIYVLSTGPTFYRDGDAPVEGIDDNQHGYVIKNLSGVYTPDQACNIAIKAYNDFKATLMVVEKNQGGDWIESMVRTKDPTGFIKFKGISASESKMGRAEPVSSLYIQRRIHHVGNYPQLEDEMCTWTGPPMPSPNELDAMVHGFAELFGLHDKSKKRMFVIKSKRH